MGCDVTETLEVIPRQWKVIQTAKTRGGGRSSLGQRLREDQSGEEDQTIFQWKIAPTNGTLPSHPARMGRAEPAGARHWARTNGAFNGSLLLEKFGQHQPLNRQAEGYAREGVDLSLSTLADQVGACTAALEPIRALIKAHVMAADQLHGPSRRMHAFACRATDDTTVPLPAKGGTTTARLWTYVRDDRPFGGTAPPAALFHFSRDRGKEHPNRHLIPTALSTDFYPST